MESGIMNLLVSLVSGAAGGNVAGALMKDKSLGTLWNSVVGILGTVAGSTVGGGALLYIVSLFKK